jgi:hypothetical protein
MILRPDATGGADDAESGIFFRVGGLHGLLGIEKKLAGKARSDDLAAGREGEL